MNVSDLTNFEAWPNETLKSYYLSIKPAFDEAQQEPALPVDTPSSGIFLSILVICLLFSLVPAIPGLLTFAFTHLFHRDNVAIYTFTIPTGSFLFWYLTTNLTTI